MRNLGLSIPASAFLLATTAVPIAQANFSLSPTFPSSILSHTCTSLSTMFDSTGNLTYAPNNLLTYSNTFSDAAWTKSSMSVASGATDPFGTAFAWTLTATGPGALLYQLQSLAGPNAIPYIWMRRKTGSGIIYLRNANNVSIDVTAQVSASWSLVYVAPTAALGGNLFLIGLATSGDEIEVYSAGYSAVTYEATPRAEDTISTGAAAYYRPRIDYDPNTLAVKGLLIEEARTNAFTQSSDLTQSVWDKPSVTITAASGTAPDGTNTAFLQTRSVGGQFYQTRYTTATRVASVYAKAGTVNYVSIAAYIGAGSAYFNLSNGTVAGQNNGTSTVSASILAVGNGWYRCSLVFSTSVAALEFHFEAQDGTNTTSLAPWSIGGSGTVLLWGPQLEEGATFPTSYIPTAASSVTRAADVVQFTGAALTALQGSAGTAIVESTDAPTNSTTSLVYIGANGATNFPLYWSASNTIRTYNGTTALDNLTMPVMSSPVRAAIAWSAAGRSITFNGNGVRTDANAFTSGGITSAYLGVGNSGIQYWLNGHVASFAIYNQRLPDATLQAKSVVGASYAANDNGVRFAFANDNLPVHWRIAL